MLQFFDLKVDIWRSECGDLGRGRRYGLLRGEESIDLGL